VTKVWGVPIEIMSEPATRKGVRSQRFRVSPDVWVTVHEDGRIGLGSYTHHLRVDALVNAAGGSTLTIVTGPISEGGEVEPVVAEDGCTLTT
jgi:hypothetical protein